MQRTIIDISSPPANCFKLTQHTSLDFLNLTLKHHHDAHLKTLEVPMQPSKPRRHPLLLPLRLPLALPLRTMP